MVEQRMQQFLRSRLLPWIGLFICLAFVFLEFFFNTAHYPLLSAIAKIADYFLIVAFLCYMLVLGWSDRRNLFRWFKNQKINILIFFSLLLLIRTPRLAALLVVLRIASLLFALFTETVLAKRIVTRVNLNPSQALVLSFAAVILVTTILLCFPASTVDGRGSSFINALFTMTSAVCVTGLSVVDIGTVFTPLGQFIILAGIQIGGLSIMVLAGSFAVLVGGRMPSRRQKGLIEMLDASTPQGLKSLMAAIIGSTVFFELIGAFCLFFLWEEPGMSFTKRAWYSIFHSVSAFCNAGFSLLPNNLMGYVDSYLLCGVIMLLIILGGIGFPVMEELADPSLRKKLKFTAIWQRLSVHAKVALASTAFLNIAGALFFLFCEFDGVLRGLSIGAKVNASIFEAVTLRTAGYNTVLQNELAFPTVVFCLVWMFIGGCPGSTAGGIKTTTATIALMAVRASVRGRDEVEIFGRSISPTTVNRAVSVALISAILLTILSMGLLATQKFPFEKIVFEAFSAFGTVGLSMGITPDLDVIGKLIVTLLMFVGRVGPLTLALAVTERRIKSDFSLPLGNLPVG